MKIKFKTDQVLGGLYGALIGDALGVPFEFMSTQAVQKKLPLPAKMNPSLREGAHEVPGGTWSDDGAQILALTDSLAKTGGLDAEDLGERLLAWYTEGRYAVDSRVFDVGNATRAALGRLMRRVAASEAGSTLETSNGNGSLMRVLPIALYTPMDDDFAVRSAMLQSRVTHGTLLAQVSCALYVIWVRRLAAGVENQEAFDQARGLVAALAPLAADLIAQHYGPDAMARPARGTGYVADCLHASVVALDLGSYAEVVTFAIGLGHDTDTTACVAGGAAGVRGGYLGIPNGWLDSLRARNLCDPIIDAFVEQVT